MTVVPQTTIQSLSTAANGKEVDSRPLKRMKMDESGRGEAVEEFSKAKDYCDVKKGVAAIKVE
jgi:hypothetical protein